MKFILLLGILIAIYYLRKWVSKKQKVQLLVSKNKLTQIFERMSFNHFESCLKTYILTGHIQTVLIEIISKVLKLINKYFSIFNFNYKREIFQLRDGALIAIDHANKLSSSPKLNTELNTNTSHNFSSTDYEKILLIVPGITSTSEDFYIQSVIEDFIEDFDCKVIHGRGFGGMKLYNEKTAGPNSFHDLFDYVQKLCTENEHKKIFVLGLSLGGYKLTRMLSHYNKQIPDNFYAASGVCLPTGIKCVEKTLAKYYGFYASAMTNEHKNNIMNNFESIFNPETCRKEIFEKKEKLTNMVRQFKTMRDCNLYEIEIIEENISEDEYYEKGDLKGHVPNLRKPFLAWFVEDDPITDYTKIPFDEFKSNPNCITIVSEHGGHLGMISGTLSIQRNIKTPIMNFFQLVDIMRNEQ